jgi:hypothetical protein
MADKDHPRVTVLLEATHCPQPRLQAPMVRLHAIVGVLIGAMPGCRQQVFEHRRVRRRQVGHDLDRCHLRRADRPLEEPTRRCGVSPWRDEHVDHLPELVDCSVHIPPLPATFT